MSPSVGIFPHEKTKAGLVNLDFPGDEIGLRRQDVAILADARDVAGALEIAQRLLERAAVVALHPERAGELDLVERPVFRRAHQG